MKSGYGNVLDQIVRELENMCNKNWLVWTVQKSRVSQEIFEYLIDEWTFYISVLLRYTVDTVCLAITSLPSRLFLQLTFVFLDLLIALSKSLENTKMGFSGSNSSSYSNSPVGKWHYWENLPALVYFTHRDNKLTDIDWLWTECCSVFKNPDW